MEDPPSPSAKKTTLLLVTITLVSAPFYPCSHLEMIREGFPIRREARSKATIILWASSRLASAILTIFILLAIISLSLSQGCCHISQYRKYGPCIRKRMLTLTLRIPNHPENVRPAFKTHFQFVPPELWSPKFGVSTESNIWPCVCASYQPHSTRQVAGSTNWIFTKWKYAFRSALLDTILLYTLGKIWSSFL